MKKYWIICLIILASCSSSDDSNGTTSNQFYKGMDLSFQAELENYNIDYKDEDGNSIELLDFVKSKGTNLVRLKLWHTPQDGQNGLEDVKTYAQKIKAQNMDFLLQRLLGRSWHTNSTSCLAKYEYWPIKSGNL